MATNDCSLERESPRMPRNGYQPGLSASRAPTVTPEVAGWSPWLPSYGLGLGHALL